MLYNIKDFSRVPFQKMSGELLNEYCKYRGRQLAFDPNDPYEVAWMAKQLKESILYMQRKCTPSAELERARMERMRTEKQRSEEAIRRQRERQIPVSTYKVDAKGNIIHI